MSEGACPVNKKKVLFKLFLFMCTEGCVAMGGLTFLILHYKLLIPLINNCKSLLKVVIEKLNGVCM